MRLIGTLDDEKKVRLFSQFLQQKGISHQIEIKKITDWESPSYGQINFLIWIEDEDKLNQVLSWFKHFNENPQDPLFTVSESSPEVLTTSPPELTGWEKQPMGVLTRLLLAICCILFFLSHLLMPSTKIPEKYSGLILFTSPIEKNLLFDYPKFYQLIDRFIKSYGYEKLEHPNDLSKDGLQLLQEINQTPFWPGFYQLLLKGGWQEAKKSFSEYPTFEKIREGEIWRLFSPCLLHADIFHIFFNMLWLIVLGKQIEQRLSKWRYTIFILIIGIVSNIAQYLSSGPNFIGFSGILCGMLAFIWMRQKFAAWEGYQLDRMTLIFMLLFIMSMAGIQLVSFFLEKNFELAFSPNIANVAHLSGGIMGFLFGSLDFFSWKPK